LGICEKLLCSGIDFIQNLGKGKDETNKLLYNKKLE